MSTPLATLFTKIGFDIDPASLARVNSEISKLENRFKRLARTMNSATSSTSSRSSSGGLGGNANATLKAIQNNTGKVAGYQHILAKDSTLRRLITATNRSNRTGGVGSAAAQRLALQRAQQEHLTQQLRSASNLQTLQQRANDAANRIAQNSLNHTRRMELQNLRRQTQQDRLTHNTNQNRNRGGGSGGIAGMGVNAQTAIGAVAGGGFASQAYDVANFTMSRNPQFEFLTGSAEEAKKQIAFVDGEVKRLSLDMISANQQYKQMLASGATSIGLEKTQELFTNASNLSTMLGLTADAQKRMTNAFSQMMSKGQVMSEELKGQLAESLPNAVGIFADALYGNGKAGSGDKAKLFKDMEDGKVKLKELTKVIEYMGTLTREDLIAQMLETPAKKLAKLKTQWILTLEKLNDAGFLDMMITALEGVTELLVDLTKWVKENGAEIKTWAAEIISVFKWLITNLPLILAYFTALKVAGWITAMQAASVAAGGFTAALTAMLIRLVLIPAGIALATLAFVELYDTVSGQDTLWARLAEQKDKGFLGYVAAITKTVLDFVTLISSGLVTGAMSAWGHMTGNQELVDSAKRTWAEANVTNMQNQEKMWGGGWWGTGNQPLSPQSINSVATSTVLGSGRIDRGNNQPANGDVVISPNAITINVANGDPVTIENTLNDIMGKWSVKAAANTSAFSLLVK